MNQQTANHLNRLFLHSKPVTLTDNFHLDGPPRQVSDLAVVLADMLPRYFARITFEEIVSAAKDRRIAATLGQTTAQTFNREWRDRLTTALFTLARKEMEAIIEADNTRRLNEYELYRLACEQGVALPPQIG